MTDGTTTPERIWIDWKKANADWLAYETPPSPELRTFDCPDAYVRADLADALSAEAQRLTSERDRLKEALRMQEAVYRSPMGASERGKWNERLNEAEARATAAEAERDRLRAALEPFDAMARELFSRNWNRGQVALAMDSPNKSCRLTFDDFLNVRAALEPPR